MITQRNLISTALMATALAMAALPLIATAYNSAEAAGYSKQRQGKHAHSKKSRRHSGVRRKRVRNFNRKRVVRRKARQFDNRRRMVRPSRPAVTMPKRVITAKPRPYARPAVTMPKTVITTKPRPYARPAVTTPKTVITTKPRPYARPAVTTPKTVVNGNNAVDPTSGRINNREKAAKQAKYQQCAAFSIRVQQGCYSQAQGDPKKQKSCRQHYQSNVVRCQGLL
ncbi:MAG: hypothetical protein JXQ99_08920 [Hyphomicrobiaceae bacterium]